MWIIEYYELILSQVPGVNSGTSAQVQEDEIGEINDIATKKKAIGLKKENLEA